MYIHVAFYPSFSHVEPTAPESPIDIMVLLGLRALGLGFRV